MTRSDRERLQDILEAIAKIEIYAKRGRQAFEREELIQVWMAYHLQIIGEAISSMSENLQNNYPQIPWSEIIAMRNILVHEYFGIDLEEVWSTVQQDLPELKRQIEAIVERMGETSE